MSRKTSKPKMTKEELAKFWKDYYDQMDSIYPVKSFEIQDKNGEILTFYLDRPYIGESPSFSFSLKDAEYQKAFEQQKRLDLLGVERDEENDISETFESKAFIDINKEEKWVNFGVEWQHMRNGYGRAIYDNYLHILEILGIPDKEQYQLRIYGNPDHDFFKRMQTEELVAKASDDPNKEKASQLLAEFSQYPHTMKFSELNTIIQYAITSNISTTKIAEAINDNGFNIFYTTINSTPYFEKEDFEQFKSFGITGLKPTSMHHHFMRNKDFGFIKLLDDIDMQDATKEFRKVFEEVKTQHEKEKNDGSYTYQTIEKYGVAENIVLNWDHFGLLLKHVDPNIQAIVKKGAINKFGEFDPEHENQWRGHDIDYSSLQTFRMLRDAGLMDKDAYIALYQKALNRNYDLKEFDKAISSFVSEEEKAKAKEEILRNAFYPSPKGNWQKSSIKGKQHKISRITIPKEVAKTGSVRTLLKQEILKQGTAKKTKIRTDMTGRNNDGKPIVVDNLKDWLFGVPGAHGNLQMEGASTVILPPQTPNFAVNLIENTFRDIEYPNSDGR